MKDIPETPPATGKADAEDTDNIWLSDLVSIHSNRERQLDMGKIRGLLFILCTFIIAFVSTLISQAAAGPEVPGAPSPAPPAAVRYHSTQPLRALVERSAAPITEWTFHKTPDSSHPDGNEQQMLWLMNRARANPALEGKWLATTDLPEVAGGRDYFKVDTQLLQEEFDAIAATPPAAFDARLYQAAEDHSLDMIARNSQDHVGQFEAIDDHEFSYSSARGNVFFSAGSALNAHATFNIDYGGSDGSGMQPGRGHRQAIMAIDGNYTNAGLAAVEKPSGNAYQGYYAVTGNYCRAQTGMENHYNRFLVGTVWDDLNANEMYDPGEGLADVSVVPDQGLYYAVTADGGGYAIPVTSSGSYEITFSGAALDGTYTRSATVGSDSVLLDLCVTDEPAPPASEDPQIDGGNASGDEGGSGCFLGSL